MKAIIVKYSLFFHGKLFPVGSVIEYPDDLPLPPNVKKIESTEQTFYRKRGRPRLTPPTPDEIFYPKTEEN
ncbi:MAG: hypothetical protein QHH13_11575 [Melioribacter sp.]|nr:hypothetical protein [Melioribacter sp.]